MSAPQVAWFVVLMVLTILYVSAIWAVPPEDSLDVLIIAELSSALTVSWVSWLVLSGVL